jgi:ATP-dependent HslUV protease ATP-binding subunit HslU
VTASDNLTPKEILARLDEYVVGQDKAKRAVAVALRNRWRRRQLPRDVADDVYPKNILLMGPTGVGKTEIARRLAALARAPFVKVEATKYSEVGYHGRDVESMVRDLAEAAVAMVRREHQARVADRAAQAADARLLEALARQRGLVDPAEQARRARAAGVPPSFALGADGLWRPAGKGEGEDARSEQDEETARAEREAARAALARELAEGELEQETVSIEVLDQRSPTLAITGPQGDEAMGIDARALQEMWGRAPQVRTKTRALTVAEARQILVEEEADKLIDQDAIQTEALDRTQNDGILFIDEIDKVVGSGGGDGPDVSREGVQRDLLSVVEGCDVYTRYGHVRTDHILFIAAGAFHFHKPSELIPELQGRFPVRVALSDLDESDFVRILQEPRNSLVRQYQALFGTEGVDLQFTDDGIERLAHVAFRANATTQNIGARRLMTILEKCLEGLSFRAADELRGQTVRIDRAFVDSQLGDTADDEDLIPYHI